MKRTAVFVLVTTLALIGCGSKSEPLPAAPRATVSSQESSRQAAAPSLEDRSVSVGRSECEGAGGTCRKSACRTNEVPSMLECGTERGCCLPAQ